MDFSVYHFAMGKWGCLRTDIHDVCRCSGGLVGRRYDCGRSGALRTPAGDREIAPTECAGDHTRSPLRDGRATTRDRPYGMGGRRGAVASPARTLCVSLCPCRASLCLLSCVPLASFPARSEKHSRKIKNRRFRAMSLECVSKSINPSES